MMEILRSIEAVGAAGGAAFGPVVATVGNFDGVHCGHRWILERVRQRARTLGVRSAVVTFDPHPARALRPEQPRPMITPLERKLELLAETGVDAAVVLPFTAKLAAMRAREFVEEVLVGRLGVRELHEGENFRFGRGAEGDTDHLRALGEAMGFGVVAHGPEYMRGGVVSSSRIRGLLAEGRLSEARHLLGRSFSVDSRPASGRGYGTRYAVPTINLAPYEELLPAHGVYVTRLRVGSRWWEAVTNVGDRPTFGADSFAVESYLLDFEPMELTEETPLRLEFLCRLRGERRWESPEALKAQIGRDVGRARRFLGLRRMVEAG